MLSRRQFFRTTAFGILLPRLSPLPAKSFQLSRRTPESQGVDSAGINAFLDATKASGLEWHSFMLMRHGKVVAEGWWKPFGPAFKHTLYSLSKSFTSSAIGFLVNEGKISVEDQVLKFFPEHTPADVSEHLKAMKIKHLLTMNTGHKTDSMPDIRTKPGQSWVKTFLEKPVDYPPSTFFMYNTGATYMLGAIVSKVTGQLLVDYLKPRLFEPLAITDYDWEQSPEGYNTAGYGLRITTEDIAKFGQFYLQKGQWNGKQLLPVSWVETATSKQTTSQQGDNDWSQGYGYQFWRCKPGFYRGDGAYGQYCIVMPEQDAVLAMTCESFDLQKSLNVSYQTLLPAFKNAPLPENPDEQARLKANSEALSLSVPKGAATRSTLHDKISNKVFQMQPNDFGIAKIGLGLFDDAAVLRIQRNNESGFHKIGFGWEQWKTSKNQKTNYFPVNPATVVHSQVAATGTWLNENTLQVNLKYIETVHGDTLTFVFEDNKLHLQLLNSVSANTKNNPDKRQPLSGTLL